MTDWSVSNMTPAPERSASRRQTRCAAPNRRGRRSGARRAPPDAAARAPPTAPPAPKPANRAEKSEARRQAIVAAALEEFCARGFAATRLDDVARRAGVAKGTIYLHFRDKEALFREIVGTMLVPLVAVLERRRRPTCRSALVLERFVDLFVREIYAHRAAQACCASS